MRLAALRPADEEVKPRTNLDKAAIALIKAAGDGDVPALKELGDRLDGKVTQPVSGDADAPPIALQIIELVAVKPDAAAD